MPTTVHDVAARILAKVDGGISTMKLQKLAYLSQGWTLAFLGRPLFEEDFEAWQRGPVSRDLFAYHRREFRVSSWPVGDRKNLEEDERIILSAVIRNYGALSGIELSELTHKDESPWSITRARNNIPEGAPSRVIIPKELIRDFYKRELLVTESGSSG